MAYRDTSYLVIDTLPSKLTADDTVEPRNVFAATLIVLYTSHIKYFVTRIAIFVLRKCAV
jgi:hypothetical protein